MHRETASLQYFLPLLVDVFLREFPGVVFVSTMFIFWIKVRGTLPFKMLWQHSDSEKIRSLSHFLIISLRFFSTLRLNLFKRGASLENRSCREFIVKWIIDNCVCSYYYSLTYTKRSSPEKSPVISLRLSSVSCLRSISKYSYGALVTFWNASIIKALFPVYICRARLANYDASRPFFNKTR